MNIPKRFWNVSVAAIGLLALFLLAAAIAEFKSIAYVGANPSQTNTITLNGTGDAYAIPDVATFTYTVTDTEKAVADAQTKATAKSNAALAVVRAAGVADKDIQTTSYSIYPQYEYQNAVCPTPAAYDASAGSGSVSSGVMIPASPPTAIAPIYCPQGKSVLTGYQVSQTTEVKLRDLTKAGSLLTSLGSAGVENLNGPNFTVDDPTAVQAEARSKAIADAQSQAQVLANQLGVSIVGIVSFTENNNGSYPVPMYAMGVADTTSSKAAATPEVSTGQQKVTDDVSITYEIR